MKNKQYYIIIYHIEYQLINQIYYLKPSGHKTLSYGNKYSTNLTDKQRKFIEKIVNTQKRRRKYSVVKLLYISYRYLIFQFLFSFRC